MREHFAGRRISFWLREAAGKLAAKRGSDHGLIHQPTRRGSQNYRRFRPSSRSLRRSLKRFTASWIFGPRPETIRSLKASQWQRGERKNGFVVSGGSGGRPEIHRGFASHGNGAVRRRIGPAAIAFLVLH